MRLRSPLAVLAALLLLADADASNAAPTCGPSGSAVLQAEIGVRARRVTVGEALHPLFGGLWLKARGRLPAVPPDSVTVFAAPGRPLLVAYSHEDCLLGVLTLPRDSLLVEMNRRFGAPA
jgi:hypothetical protein